MAWVCYTKRFIPRLNTKYQYKIMRKNIYVQVSTHNLSYILRENGWVIVFIHPSIKHSHLFTQPANIMPQFFIFLSTSQLIMNNLHSSNLVKFIRFISNYFSPKIINKIIHTSGYLLIVSTN
jgi:hypothetical protein